MVVVVVVAVVVVATVVVVVVICFSFPSPLAIHWSSPSLTTMTLILSVLNF